MSRLTEITYRCGRKILTLALGLACLGGAAAWACNVPVFRYALERWRPDPYRVTLLHRGPLTDADKELVKALEDQQDRAISNLFLRTVDLESPEGSDEQRRAEHNHVSTATACGAKLSAVLHVRPFAQLVIVTELLLRLS